MLATPCPDLILLLISFLMLYSIWSTHFLLIQHSTTQFVNREDLLVLRQPGPSLPTSPRFILSLISLDLGMLLGFLWVFRAHPLSLFFRHLTVGPYGYRLACLLLLLLLAFTLALSSSSSQALLGSQGLDLFTSFWLMSLFLPFGVWANTLLALFFFIELASVITFYALVSSRDLFIGGSRPLGPSQPRHASMPKEFFNALFFQFWSAFFSSVALVYSILCVFFFFGTTEWAYLAYLASLASKSGYLFSSLVPHLGLSLVLFAVIVKLGLSPLFFYKIEIYRGLPLLVLLLYSTSYFFIFLTYFFTLLTYFMGVPFALFGTFLAPLLLVSLIFFVSNLFDASLIRNFLVMSSMVNSISFFFLALSLIS
jgi:hypothetical protein